MNIEILEEILGANFYTGVPDSQLKALCDYLVKNYGISDKHIIAANEGNCTALAAGYHLATGKIPVVYMQNSGIGNSINPMASLLHSQVYAIPCIFIIGWRGEPNTHDEPQHIYQGEITLNLLCDMNIDTYIIDKKTTKEELEAKMREFKPLLDIGKSVAFVVRKDALSYKEKVVYENENTEVREDIIRHIVEAAEEDIIVSTTGKASRELFEIREAKKQSHKYDFLTVGAMGHSSSIALGIAINKPNRRIWCIDGDGAALMHMGSMAVIGSNRPRNMVHIIINNGAHETVGGMPTVASKIDFVQIAKGCGYPNAVTVDDLETLHTQLKRIKERQELSFIEIKCSIGCRDDLGRPTTTAKENKESFMEYLND